MGTGRRPPTGWMAAAAITAGLLSGQACSVAAPSGTPTTGPSALTGAAGTPTTGPSAPLDPRLADASCRFSIPDSTRVRCLDFTVPADRRVTAGATITLRVALVSSTAARPAADPVLWADFGDGANSIQDSLNRIPEMPFLAGRDVILLDQRGTGESNPFVRCRTVDTVAGDLLTTDPATIAANTVAAWRDCRTSLGASGVDLGTITGAANVADLVDLRAALGIRQWDLFGISAETWVALGVMRADPQGVRAAVLDSVVPAQADLLADWGPNAGRAIDHLFAVCAADPECAKVHPDLAQRFDATVARLNASPAHLAYSNQFSGRQEEANATGGILTLAVFDALYDTTLVPQLPALIEGAARGDTRLLERELSLEAMAPFWSAAPVYYAVDCAEFFDFTTRATIDAALAGSRPAVRTTFGFWAPLGLDICAALGIDRAGPPAHEAVSSDIPTLILSGGFDPITPEPDPQLAASTLSHARIVSFPSSGHGVLQGNPCAASIANAFLADPAAAPDQSCVATIPAPSFTASISP
jgi:pimeloyl-ACP methyl ester carboxylesterase